jgi:hypothetical protein
MKDTHSLQPDESMNQREQGLFDRSKPDHSLRFRWISRHGRAGAYPRSLAEITRTNGVEQR